MKNYRIFVENLPETATETVIKRDFERFVLVKSVEIRERKNVTHKHTSCFYAYINVETDDNALQKCFQHFNENYWLGQYVKIQIAKESFLEKLKREREAKTVEIVTETIATPEIVQIKCKKRKVSVSSSSESDETEGAEIQLPDDFKIVNNKNAVRNGRIEGVGNAPVHEFDMKTKKKSRSLDKFRAQADTKRIDSVLEKKKVYRDQKNAIKAALSYTNKEKSNKIVFNNEDAEETGLKLRLFDDGDNEESDPDELNEILKNKEKFKGKSGEKLLNLQSRYKNDERFKLDEKFLDENPGNIEECEDDLSNEKTKQLEILSEILGQEIQTKPTSSIKHTSKVMRRFDPSKSEHVKYVKKIKEVAKIDEETSPQIPTETIPEVSKEIFYKVDETIKETLENDTSFSLLKTFQKNVEKPIETTKDSETISKPTRNGFASENPFKYDSSDEEDEEVEEIVPAQRKPLKIWSEPFFFQDDDYRFQEGTDFVKKIATSVGDTENTGNFEKLRRNLKEIVKTKVRNNMRKNRMFKKKLGGSRKKKAKRMDKALKR